MKLKRKAKKRMLRTAHKKGSAGRFKKRSRSAARQFSRTAACISRARARQPERQGDEMLERFEKGESIADFIDFSAGKFVRIA
jgi:hypothetical protein